MGYLQKYFHRGAFYQDKGEAEGVADRDLAGARFADDVNRELLPKALQMRDMTKLGKKGATKYRDLKSEDTGQWGMDEGRQRRPGFGADRFGDERFQPDRGGDGRRGGDGDGAKGANAIPLGERKVVPGAPEGPRRDRDERSRPDDRHRGDKYREDDRRGDSRRERDTGDRHYDDGYPESARERDAVRHDDRHRRRSRSRSRSPRRNRDEYGDRRKRERSRDRDRDRDRDRYDGDKRQRVEAR